MFERLEPFHHSITVRYSEVDQQGVVFNSHYLEYLDDTMDTWIRQFSDLRQKYSWDMMNKKCNIEWHSSIQSGDILDIYAVVTHWGSTSWRLGYIGLCKGQKIFTAEIVYISVRLGNNEPIDTPIGVRNALGEAVDFKKFLSSVFKTNNIHKLKNRVD
jgi:acyl-CoA thioester hydrolase